jgi:hypothetical protein
LDCWRYYFSEIYVNYSSTSDDNFGNSSAWTPAVILSDGVVAVDATVDSQGNLHVVYVSNVSSEIIPAGVYYLKSTNSGLSWSASFPLYNSQYFRSLDADSAHVHISAGLGSQGEHIYITWDNRPIKRVYLSRSNDGGNTWNQPVEMDGPTPDTVTTEPFNLQAFPIEDNVLLIWQAGLQSGFDCTQYYRYSTDGGNSWGERQTMLAELVGCPQENELYPDVNGYSLLWTQ